MGGAKGLLLIIKNGLTNHENLPQRSLSEYASRSLVSRDEYDVIALVTPQVNNIRLLHIACAVNNLHVSTTAHVTK